MADTRTAADSARDRSLTRPLTAAEFTDFVEPHWSTMARFARSAVPTGGWEDVLQDALTTAWRKRRQYDTARGSPRAWLLAVVADTIYKRRRKPPAHDSQLRDVGLNVDRTANVDLRRALDQLTARQRAAVTLRYYLELSTEETAQVMKCSTGTVKSTLSDAKRRLKHLLGEDYDDD